MFHAAAAAAKSLQSCPTLCDSRDGSPPGSPIPGILQARTLEWVAISFPIAWKWKVKVKSLSRVRFSGTPWTAAYQAPLSMGFSRQEYWSGVGCHCLLQWVRLEVAKAWMVTPHHEQVEKSLGSIALCSPFSLLQLSCSFFKIRTINIFYFLSCFRFTEKLSRKERVPVW